MAGPSCESHIGRRKPLLSWPKELSDRVLMCLFCSQQLEIWRKREDRIVKQSCAGWDEMMELVKGHKVWLTNVAL